MKEIISLGLLLGICLGTHILASYLKDIKTELHDLNTVLVTIMEFED